MLQRPLLDVDSSIVAAVPICQVSMVNLIKCCFLMELYSDCSHLVTVQACRAPSVPAAEPAATSHWEAMLGVLFVPLVCMVADGPRACNEAAYCMHALALPGGWGGGGAASTCGSPCQIPRNFLRILHMLLLHWAAISKSVGVFGLIMYHASRAQSYLLIGLLQ